MSAVTSSPAERGLRIPHGLRRHASTLIVYGLILILGVYASLLSPNFLTERNIFNVLRTAAFLGTVAIGETLVIISGGIDLSVGSVIKLAVLISAILMDGKPENIAVAAAGTLAMGAVIGLINGLLITKVRIAPFIVTLGAYSILRGVQLLGDDKASWQGRARLPAPLRSQVRAGSALGDFSGAHGCRGDFCAPADGVWPLHLRHRRQRAGGAAVRYPRRSGQDRRLRSLQHSGRADRPALSRPFGGRRPVTGEGAELQAITAVILGGTSLFGGQGGLIGTLGGVLLMGLTNNVLVILNVSSWYQELIQGLIIVGAVALYKQKRR